MTAAARVPAHLRGLSESARRALLDAVERDHKADPPPPLTPATREALRVLLKRTTPKARKAA
jgi:hypothetical protein